MPLCTDIPNTEVIIMPNALFDSMISEATEEVANKGWREADQNAVTLAAFGMLKEVVTNKMHRITRPFWAAAFAIGTGVIWYIVSSVMGL